MVTKQRGRVYVRSEDGSATTVSSRPDNFASRLCRRHRIENLKDAATVGLLPAFVDRDVLEREAARVLSAGAFDRDAERKVRREPPVHNERVLQARIAHEATRLRADELAGVIEPNVDVLARHQIASRAVQIMTRAPADIAIFELDQDLDLYTDLVFARDVTIATFGDIRIYRGAALVSTSSSFILRAASAKGNLVAVEAHPNDVNLNDHILTRL